MNTDKSIEAVAETLGVNIEDITVEENSIEDEIELNVEGAIYLILTEERAETRARDYILETLWAFQPGFLANVTGIDEDVFDALNALDGQSGATEAILALIEYTCGIDTLVAESIRTDDYGPFLNSYDGETMNVVIDNECYIMVRTD